MPDLDPAVRVVLGLLPPGTPVPHGELCDAGERNGWDHCHCRERHAHTIAAAVLREHAEQMRLYRITGWAIPHTRQRADAIERAAADYGRKATS